MWECAGVRSTPRTPSRVEGCVVLIGIYAVNATLPRFGVGCVALAGCLAATADRTRGSHCPALLCAHPAAPGAAGGMNGARSLCAVPDATGTEARAAGRQPAGRSAPPIPATWWYSGRIGTWNRPEASARAAEISSEYQ